MRFEYKRYDLERGPSIERPIIPIVLRNVRDLGTPAIAYEALVDSGSDRNIFPAEIADLLGIDLTNDPTAIRYVGGVVADVRRPVYFHPIEIEVGGLGGRIHDDSRLHDGLCQRRVWPARPQGVLR